MLFFVFFLVLLVSFEFLTFNNNILYILYVIYFTIFTANFSKTNIVSNINFKYTLKSFFIWLLGFFFYLKSILFTNFYIFKRTPNLRWKPLFKRSSYFGLYRSTRNQYLNK